MLFAAQIRCQPVFVDVLQHRDATVQILLVVVLTGEQGDLLPLQSVDLRFQVVTDVFVLRGSQFCIEHQRLRVCQPLPELFDLCLHLLGLPALIRAVLFEVLAHDGVIQLQYLLLRYDAPQHLREDVMGYVGPVPLFAGRSRLAVVVVVLAAVAADRSAGNGLAARPANQKAAKRQGFVFGAPSLRGALPAMQDVLHLIEDGFRYKRLVDAFDPMGALVFVGCDLHPSAVDHVVNDVPELASAHKQPPFVHPPPHRLHIGNTKCHLLEQPPDVRGQRFIRYQDGLVLRVARILVAFGSLPDPTALLTAPAHAGHGVQRPAVVLYFRGGQVEGQHHLVLGNIEVERLLDGLRLDSQLFERADHPVGVTGIAAKAVPLQKQQQVGHAPVLLQRGQQLLELRPVERFGRMVLPIDGYDIDALQLAVGGKPFLLVGGTVAVNLFVGRDADVENGGLGAHQGRRWGRGRWIWNCYGRMPIPAAGIGIRTGALAG